MLLQGVRWTEGGASTAGGGARMPRPQRAGRVWHLPGPVADSADSPAEQLVDGGGGEEITPSGFRS